MNDQVREPIYVRIQAFIKNSIDKGDFRQGDKLPSEPVLAKQFATTRATVQNALKTLEFQGLIVRHAGRGTFVAPRRVTTDLDTVRLLSFEEQMEEKGRKVQYRLISFSHLIGDGVLCNLLDLSPGARVSRIVRLRLLDGEPFSVEDRYIGHVVASRIKLADLEVASIHRILQGLSIEIGRIDVSIHADAALPWVAEELAIKRASPLLVREHHIFDIAERPLLTGQSFYRQEFRFTYSNNPRKHRDPLSLHHAVSR